MKPELIRYYLIGAGISFVIVALGILGVHTPLAVISFYLSIPLMPVSILIGLIAQPWLSDTAMTISLYFSQVLFGGFAYGLICFISFRCWSCIKGSHLK